ncbi:MAG TPA: hypothetical protein PL196_10845 [Burkholderiaceae bacterium]|nr:hypothetical protein [Burkholderiaceae bacterium]
MSLFEALAEAPERLSWASRFTILCGLLYMGNGLLLLIWPGAAQTLMQEAEFVGRESALVRLLGMTVIVIGWFYVFGGRSGGRQFVAATVLDRIVLVPLVLVPLIWMGVFPHMLALFAVLDPTLALVAWWLLSRDQRG